MFNIAENDERRRDGRRTTLLGGTLRFTTRTGTLSCRVRNLSATGARLEVANAYWVPDRFELELLHHDIRVHAKVVWRDGDALGVVFVRNRVGLFESASQGEQILSLQAERERLRSRVRHLTDEN